MTNNLLRDRFAVFLKKFDDSTLDASYYNRDAEELVKIANKHRGFVSIGDKIDTNSAYIDKKESLIGKAFDAGVAYATGNHKDFSQSHPDKEEYIRQHDAEQQRGEMLDTSEDGFLWKLIDHAGGQAYDRDIGKLRTALLTIHANMLRLPANAESYKTIEELTRRLVAGENADDAVKAIEAKSTDGSSK